MTLKPDAYKTLNKFVLAAQSGFLLCKATVEDEERFEWVQPAFRDMSLHLEDAHEFNRQGLISWLKRASEDENFIPKLPNEELRRKLVRPDLDTLQVIRVQVSRHPSVIDGVGRAAALLGANSRLSKGDRRILGIAATDLVNLESLIPGEDTPAEPAVKVEESLAFQYRDEVVAKEMQKVYEAFPTTQPATESTIDSAFTSELFLAKNGLPEGASEGAAAAIVCSALASAGFVHLAKAVRESYRFSARLTGEPGDYRVNLIRLQREVSEVLEVNSKNIGHPHSLVRRTLNRLGVVFGSGQ
jgi:hypothetical protein